MNRAILALAATVLTLSTGACSKEQPAKPAAPATPTTPSTPPAPAAPAKPVTPAAPDAPAATGGLLDLTVKDIEGKDVPLSKYAGKVLLVVNVASKCGNTPQYAALEKLYTSRKEKGLVILGFPANDFGHQEPGTEAEIKAFCTGTYQVDFPMFAKVIVKGDGKCELYKRLAAATPGADKDAKPLGEPEWNFAKYLVNRKGEVIARFKASASPSSPAVTEAIDAALAESR